MRFQTCLFATLVSTAAGSVPASTSNNSAWYRGDHDRQQSIIKSKSGKTVKKRYDNIIKSHGHVNGSNIPLTQAVAKSSTTRLLGPSTQTTKVIGGSLAPVNQYPWFASLDRNGSLYCGGSLIDSQFVLTAAHCEPKITDTVRIGNLCPSDSSNCGQKQRLRRIKQIFVNSDYATDFWHGVVSDDVMIIQLDEPVDIAPVEIDSGDYSSSYAGGEPLWGLGFGISDYKNQKQPINLLHTELAYVTQEQCLAQHNFLGPSTMCAYYEGRDVCRGDSGGPLVDQENGNQVVIGLVSYGEICDGSTELPGVYTRIADVWPWIRSVICEMASTTTVPDFCQLTLSPTVSSSPTMAPTPCGEVDLKLKLNTDAYANETSFKVHELETNRVYGNANLEDNTDYDASICLPEITDKTCYEFNIYDKEGDGIGDNDGSANDNDGYCVNINGKDIKCNFSFDGNRETVRFPKESCDRCDPTAPEISISTSRSNDFFITIYSGSEFSSVWPIDRFDGSLLVSNAYYVRGPYLGVELCRDACYIVSVENIGDNQFDLYFDGKVVATERDTRRGFGSCSDYTSTAYTFHLSTSAILMSLVLAFMVI